MQQEVRKEVWANQYEDDGMNMEDSLLERIEDWFRNQASKRPKTVWTVVGVAAFCAIAFLWKAAGLV